MSKITPILENKEMILEKVPCRCPSVAVIEYLYHTNTPSENSYKIWIKLQKKNCLKASDSSSPTLMYRRELVKSVSWSSSSEILTHWVRFRCTNLLFKQVP